MLTMSALGHKRTFCDAGTMSALPQWRTFRAAISMSAFCQKRTSSVYSTTASAIESTPEGSVRPSDLAVFRLTTNSNLVA